MKLNPLLIKRDLYATLKVRLQEMKQEIEEAQDFNRVGELIDQLLTYWTLFKAFALEEVR